MPRTISFNLACRRETVLILWCNIWKVWIKSSLVHNVCYAIFIQWDYTPCLHHNNLVGKVATWGDYLRCVTAFGQCSSHSHSYQMGLGVLNAIRCCLPLIVLFWWAKMVKISLWIFGMKSSYNENTFATLILSGTVSSIVSNYVNY